MKPRLTEHPILFSTPMVQAILKGEKTMTRRIVKPQGKFPSISFTAGFRDFDVDLLGTLERQFDITCLYGKPGDLLWVRETFEEGCMGGYIYKADRTDEENKKYKECGYKWKSPRFMPKDAARIWLKIADMKVERLHNITEEDAKAEGSEFQLWEGITNSSQSYKNGFTSLWLHINGAESWNSNPWVWVIEFKRIDK